MKSSLSAVVLVIVVILIYVYSVWNTSAYEDYLYGFWVADADEFCESSGIESMMLFVGAAEGDSRTCYLVIMNDLCNQSLTLTYRKGWAPARLGAYSIVADVEFEAEQIWCDSVVITVDMRDGSMRVTSAEDKTVYAVLNKQHDTTNHCRDMSKCEVV